MLLTKNRFSLFFLPSSLFLLLSLDSCVSSADRVCFGSFQKCVRVEVVQKPDELSRGLMFRKSLPANAGMLFIFPKSDIYPFWMKNTLIPLDIIWLDETQKIVHIEHDVPPCSSDPCPVYTPPFTARYVLEVNAHFTVSQNINVHDQVGFSGSW